MKNQKRKCKECNKLIHKSKRRDAIFCDHKCRMAYYNERSWRKDWFDFTTNYFCNYN